MDNPIPVDFVLIARKLQLSPTQVENATRLLDEGNTVPFITRYRKERTGHLDEEQLRAIEQCVAEERQLHERAQTILRLIETQGKLTPELRDQILAADSLKRLDDLYLPYRPKKRSRASTARERGLEPLAQRIWQGQISFDELTSAASAFVSVEKELPSSVEVLQGASDILAEQISEDASLRAVCRGLSWDTGQLFVSAINAQDEKAQPYRDYFEFNERVNHIPPHRVLALNRGEKEGALRIKFTWDDDRVMAACEHHLGIPQHLCAVYLKDCTKDALNRLIQPSLEREVRRELSERAEGHAIAVFARNLRNLLLQPPLQGQRVLAIDPGFRTGCKVAVLDEIGNCLLTDVVYVTGSAEKRATCQQRLIELLREHHIEIVAIGNGTACRETEELIAELIAEQLPDLKYLIVNEAGASIYSASVIAREEFPDLDATARGTISIGRRLLDPLSELVKIEPQHIGVGLYQHDLSAKELKASLDKVIESCVNYVGVDLNTASASLLCHVSGLNQLTARRLVEWREQNGRFQNRQQLLKVTGIGEATFTQAAGFLKILGGDEPLDHTWIHPESYPVARQVLNRLGIAPENMQPGKESESQLREHLAGVEVPQLATELQVGQPTLEDILESLAKPGRDPRGSLPQEIFKKGILKLEDLHPGMELRGTALNVVDFGVFLDVGLKDSGLVHISEMSSNYVRSPHDVVSVGDVVTVWVKQIDLERRRVSLTMINPAAPPISKPTRQASSKPPAPVKRAEQPPRKPEQNTPRREPPPKPRREPRPAAPKAAKPPDPESFPDTGKKSLRGFDELKKLFGQG